MAELLLKFLREDGTGPYSDYQWPLPKKLEDGTWELGEWVMANGELRVCENGIHACTLQQALSWLNARCFAIEYRDGYEVVDDKVLGRKARLVSEYEGWNERTQRLFTCDCAEHVLHIYEAQYPDRDSPREAIRVARKYANGKATPGELTAAWDAARAAARAAERKWQAKRLAYYLFEFETSAEG